MNDWVSVIINICAYILPISNWLLKICAPYSMRNSVRCGCLDKPSVYHQGISVAVGTDWLFPLAARGKQLESFVSSFDSSSSSICWVKMNSLSERYSCILAFLSPSKQCEDELKTAKIRINSELPVGK